jgi:hypothetical protein
MVQRASEGKKYGDTNKEHVTGLYRLESYILDLTGRERYYSKLNHRLNIPDSYRDDSNPHGYHEVDLTILPSNLSSVKRRKLYLEVDGERHSSKQVRVRDGIVNEVVKLFYPKDRLIRFHKDELNGTPEDFKHYVNEKLLGLADPYKTQVI